MLSWWFLYLQIGFTKVSFSHHVPESNHVYIRNGDFMLGGLFPLHDEDCQTLRELETLHRVEAMVYAIEVINNMTGSHGILPNISLGFEIYDTCSSEAVSLSNGLRFVRYLDIKGWHCTLDNANYGVNQSTLFHNPVMGVIGTESSSTTIVVDQTYSIFHLPMVSYFATSDDLSDTSRFPYFLRVVPPDSLQVQAIVDLLLYFDWNYVSFVYSDDSYGRNAYKRFKKLITDLPICIAWDFEIVDEAPRSYFDDMIEKILENENARVVILFIDISNANNFLAAMNRTGSIGKLQLIGSDGWGMSITEIDVEHMPAAHGALKTHLADEVVINFEQYFKKLNVTNRRSNPWFSKFWFEYLNCPHRRSAISCLDAYRNGFSEESGVSRVMDSVLVYAHALNLLLRENCPGLKPRCVKAMRNINNTLLYSYMKTLNFTGFTGDLSFDSQGDVRGIYEIENIQCYPIYNCSLKQVGSWNSLKETGERLDINEQQVAWGVNATVSGYTLVPRSYCSDRCNVGQAIIHHSDGCCWSCSNCSTNSITVFNQTACQDCGGLSAPNYARNECVKIVPTYTEWRDPWAVAIVSLDTVGLICASAVLFGYILNNNHPLIKASSRELSYMMLIGVFSSYLLIFSLIAKPSIATCYVIRIGYMMCFTLTYAPILTRANRIYRIFKAGKRSTKRPGCISPHSQVLIASNLIMIQVSDTDSNYIDGCDKYIKKLNFRKYIFLTKMIIKINIATFLILIGNTNLYNLLYLSFYVSCKYRMT